MTTTPVTRTVEMVFSTLQGPRFNEHRHDAVALFRADLDRDAIVESQSQASVVSAAFRVRFASEAEVDSLVARAAQAAGGWVNFDTVVWGR